MNKGMRFPLYNLLLCLLAVIFCILLCLCFQAAEDRWYLKWDLSPDRLSALSDYTTEKLKSLDTEVSVYLVHTPGTHSSLLDLVQETLSRMRSINPNLKTAEVNPAGEPQRLLSLNGSTLVEEGTLFVRGSDGTRTVRILPSELLFSTRIGEEIYTIYTGEARVIGAVSHVSSPSAARAVFLSGHGETGEQDCTSLSLQLNAVGLRVITANLSNFTAEPNDVLLMIDPRTDLTEREQLMLADHLDRGGAFFLSFGSGTPVSGLSRLQAVCSLYGLGMEQGWLVENPLETQRYIDRVEWLNPRLEGDQSLADNLSGRLILPNAAALSSPLYRPGVTLERLLSTSGRAVLHRDSTGRADQSAEGDVTGGFLLGAYAGNSAGMRFLLLGSADMLRDGEWLDASENLDLISSMLLRMTHQEVTYSLDAGVKRLPAHTIRFPNEQVRIRTSIFLLALLPCILLLTMAAVLIKRRRL